MPIYQSRIKSTRAGVVVVYHEATTNSRAEESARKYANELPGQVYIGTRPFISFTDANLLDDEPGDEQLRRGPGRPRKDEQRPGAIA